MRVIRLRGRRGGKKRELKHRRLYIQPPLEMGDVLLERDGFQYTLVGEHGGRPVNPLAVRMYNTTRKDEIPRVLIWEFSCACCGKAWRTKRGASYRPTARRCFECKEIKKGVEEAIGKAQEAGNGCEG